MKETNSYTIEDKLNIRPITMNDTDNIIKWRNNERVRNNFIFRETFTTQMHENWMNTKVAGGEVEQFIIEELDTNRPIGSIYFRDVDYSTRQAEYGIFIGEDDAIGKGYGTLVARWAVDYACCIMQLKKLILRVYADNKAAVRSYQAAGFCQEKYILEKEKKEVDLLSVIKNESDNENTFADNNQVKGENTNQVEDHQQTENRALVIMAVHFA